MKMENQKKKARWFLKRGRRRRRRIVVSSFFSVPSLSFLFFALSSILTRMEGGFYRKKAWRFLNAPTLVIIYALMPLSVRAAHDLPKFQRGTRGSKSSKVRLFCLPVSTSGTLVVCPPPFDPNIIRSSGLITTF